MQKIHESCHEGRRETKRERHVCVSRCDRARHDPRFFFARSKVSRGANYFSLTRHAWRSFGFASASLLFLPSTLMPRTWSLAKCEMLLGKRRFRDLIRDIVKIRLGITVLLSLLLWLATSSLQQWKSDARPNETIIAATGLKSSMKLRTATGNACTGPTYVHA